MDKMLTLECYRPLIIWLSCGDMRLQGHACISGGTVFCMLVVSRTKILNGTHVKTNQ